MTVKVCDAVMGSGKSESAIAYMNEHPDQRFIYITPYLDESKRIKKGCPKLKFVEPSKSSPDVTRHTKTAHTAELIRQGKNITTTHQAFKNYSPEMLDDIRRFRYTLIIDENVDVLERYEVHPDDLKMVIDAGYITENNGRFEITNDNYHGKVMHDMFRLLRTRELVHMTDEDGDELFYWALPPDLITSFENVFILTYMFSGQSLHHFLQIYNIPYEKIGIERTESGGYRFGPYPGYTPEYVYSLRDMIDVLDDERMNAVGDGYHALSMNWYKRGGSNVEQLKNNMYNFFNNMNRTSPARKRLWGSYKKESVKIRGKGYTNAFLTFNARATNEFREKDKLAYPVNPFMNVDEKKFYEMHGISVDEDSYSLSIMIQWIWRSAIRDGNKITIYMPSRRMRELFFNWMDKISKEGNGLQEETVQ